MGKILYGTIAGMFSVVVLLIGSWANTVNTHTEEVDRRLAVLEANYAVINQHLIDIQEGVVNLNHQIGIVQRHGK